MRQVGVVTALLPAGSEAAGGADWAYAITMVQERAMTVKAARMATSFLWAVREEDSSNDGLKIKRLLQNSTARYCLRNSPCAHPFSPSVFSLPQLQQPKDTRGNQKRTSDV